MLLSRTEIIRSCSSLLRIYRCQALLMMRDLTAFDYNN